MDLLTHLFLPIAVVYVLRPALFEHPLAFGLAGFAIFPDVDKLVPVPGGFHSLLTLLPIALLVVGLERLSLGTRRYAPVAIALLYSHLLLDIVDGNFVTLLSPLVKTGIQLQYPGHVVLGGAWPIVVQGDLLSLAVGKPQPGSGGPGTYPLVQKYGVLSVLVFLSVIAPRLSRSPEASE
ncbi:metal-dependent hydrolase [Halomontanus rarus]|uniref:metal-dependent hydrolase n=1 Tax=Halomontanus rarus TaxID=3034020 RepID=UPI001A9A1186